MQTLPQSPADSETQVPSLGRFRSVAFLGRGGFGSVWRVEDPLRPGADLALKVLEARGARGARSVALELRAWRAVRHPALAQVLEAGFFEAPGGSRFPYLLSELVPGSPLRPLWSTEDLLPVAADLLAALDAIHSAGWRHGDLKPENILAWRSEGARRHEARILDFGLAEELGLEGARAATAGTPRYFAPEVLRGSRPGVGADLYALGLILYESLGGVLPASASEHFLKTRQGRIHEEASKAAIPEPLGRLVRLLLEPDPASRLASAREGLEVIGPSGRAARRPPSFEAPRPVGRAEALEALAAGLRAAAEGRSPPPVIALVGATGLGKTRLLREAELEAFAAGVRPLPWDRALGLLRLRRVTAPEPSSGLGSPAPEEEPSDAASRAADEASGRLVELLTEVPSALLVDDADALRPGDVALLRSLLEKLRGARLAPRGRAPRRGAPLVAIALEARRPRRAAAAALVRTLEGLPWTAWHALEPWSLGEAAACLDQVLRPRRSLGPWEGALLEDARGEPGRLRRSLAALARGGELRLEGEEWRCTRDPAKGLPPAEGQREAVESEWRRLDARSQEVLGLCAVLSEGDGAVVLEDLAAAAGLGPHETGRTLRELEALEPFSRIGGPGGAGTFRSRLDRAARAWVLRAAGPGSRRRWREGAARTPARAAAFTLQRVRAGSARLEEVLEASREGSEAAVRALARHATSPRFASSDRTVTALRLGEVLATRGGHARARDFLERALDGPAAPRDAARARILLGEIAIARRDGEAAAVYFDAAAAGPLDPGDAVHAAVGRAVADVLRGRLEEAARSAEEAMARFPDLPATHGLRGNIALVRGDIGEAERSLLEAARLSCGRGSPREEGAARTNLGRLLARAGRLEEAAAAHRQAAACFERAGSRVEAARALANLGAALRRLGDHEGSAGAALRSLEVRRELGDDAGIAVAEANLGFLARELGLPGTARRRFRAADEAARAAGKGAAADLRSSELLLESRAVLELDLGRRDEAEALASRAREARERRGEAASPEAFLLEARLAAGSGGAAPLFPARPLDERDAPALAELALARALPPRVRDPAREALEGLAERSEIARVWRWIVEAEEPRADAERAAAAAALRDRVPRLPPRDARRRALVAALRAAEAEDAWTEEARGQLRRLLDEVLYDVAPEEREGFQARDEIQEAMRMASPAAGKDRRAERGDALLREVLRLNREILGERRLERVLERIVDAAAALTRAERGALFLRREGRLVLAAARSQGRPLPGAERQVSRTIVDRVLAEGTACIATDAREEITLRSIASIEELGLRSVLCVPLRVERRVAGALYLDNPFERAVFEPGDLEVTESFCAQAVLAWRAAERRQQVAGLLRRLREANRKLHGELRLSRRDAGRRSGLEGRPFHGIVGESAAMRRVFELVQAVAPTDIPVLITGESGTGKELVARALCRESPRAERPFVAENCAAVPEGLLESSLFGHVKGAFTGAESDRAGIFELSDGGTLFLDEVAEMPLELQTRLLRALQEGEVRPLGSKRILKVDVRVVAATNRDARRAVAEGRLREDLYYRLQGAEIRVPPLRERAEDIPLLAEHFLVLAARGARPKRLEPEAMDRMLRYPWPGNVRELSNEVRRLALLAPGEEIGIEHLSPHVREGAVLRPAAPGDGAPVRTLAEAEREAIRAALRATGGHRGKAAAALGISRSTLYLKLKEMGEAGEAG
ncbi:MAG: sigma 54-interacting transcriptional regulator [Planctomycetes bacterium]|nr:sigma 54-interacting transcriptional regulator [Planctomycetota bacterium]